MLYYGLAVDAEGQVIATLDRSKPPAFKPRYGLVRIDPKTDERALITFLTNPAQGMLESDSHIADLAIERSGKILIYTVLGVDYSSMAIFRVRPKTGKRRLLSDFTNAEQGVLAGIFGIASGRRSKFRADPGQRRAGPGISSCGSIPRLANVPSSAISAMLRKDIYA